MRRIPIGTTLAAAATLVTVFLAGAACAAESEAEETEAAANVGTEDVRDLIGSQHWLKLTFKPTIDWIQDGKTGTVLELEGGWNASRESVLSLKGGAGLWGEGTPGYYHRRVELVAGRAF